MLSIAVAYSSYTFAQDTEIQKLRLHEERTYQKLLDVKANTLASAEDYDALYYRLELNLRKDTAAKIFTGNVLMRLRSLVPSLQKVDLNFYNAGMVDSVISNNIKLQFTHTNNVLSITLPSPIAKDQEITIRTFYRCLFQGSAFTKNYQPNVDRRDSTMSLSTQAEPYDARKFWPCKDDTRDKADSVDVIVTIDKDMFPVSNGTMISDIDNGDGTHTVHWAERYPIVTYLVSVAAANFNHHSMTFTHNGQTMPVENWYYSRDSTIMKVQEKYMLDGLKIYSDLFITYPFIKEKYGMAEYEWGGAMEHQTVSSMGTYGEGVVVHELSHQWFGDKVTCAGFEHIWINEGWATYCEALYYEAKGGLPALKADMAANAYFGPGTIYVETPNSFSDIFSGVNGILSYSKASWVLHMMRHAVGNSAFFKGVKNYLGDTIRSRYRSATTEEFQSYIEAASGYKLDKFIKNWIYGEYYPTYNYEWKPTQVGNQYKIDLTIQQMYVPLRQIFDLPIDITFRIGNKDTTIVVRDSTEIASFNFLLPFKPDTVLLDKDNWILKRVINTTPIANPTFDKGILLVNGIFWNEPTYTADAKSAYADSIFTGNHPYAFWDLFPNPSVGYPTNIKTITGSGNIPSDIIGKYCTIVWIGNAYNGDLDYWYNTPIYEFIKAGGNVILLTCQGQDFIDPVQQNFLSVSWTTSSPYYTTFTNYKSQIPELIDLNFTGVQGGVSAFNQTLSRSDNKLLFSSGTQGAGVWGKPMTINGKISGNFIFLSMRPYRVEHASLRKNMEYLLSQMSCTPPTDIEKDIFGIPASLTLDQNYPNPFSATTTISFTIPNDINDKANSKYSTLKIYDYLGREVATLLSERINSGKHKVGFDAAQLRSGIYYYRLSNGDKTITKTAILIK